MYINKKTLSPFFKKTNSTPQDLLAWVEFLMVECSDMIYPCIDHSKGKYFGKWDVYWGDKHESYDGVNLAIHPDHEEIYCFDLWEDYVSGNKQPLLEAVKEFKVKYKL